ncbi:MAG: sigma-E processing peptidase SpoIIGA [Butyrivibrio sp.]|nr:sigma-E processing peptidase SpoIIGA [Butyrivibrio sp.]
MYFEIYLDVLFLVNFVMDYIVLSITAGIMCATVSARPAVRSNARGRLIFYLRKILAAFLGAVWVCAMLLLRLRNPLWNAVTYFVICGLMVFTVAGKSRPGVIVRGMGIMYLTTCALGGFIHVLYYYTTIGFFLNGLVGPSGENASVWVVLGGSVIAAPAIRLFWEFAASRLSHASAKSVAVIENGGSEVRLSALCDTGNSLFDPICGEPVNVVESECVQKLIGSYEECSYHLIPYSAIGSERGLIPVVRFEKLTVIGGEGTFVAEGPLFALYSGKFAAKTDYHVLLHPMMLGGAQTHKRASGTKG